MTRFSVNTNSIGAFLVASLLSLALASPTLAQGDFTINRSVQPGAGKMSVPGATGHVGQQATQVELTREECVGLGGQVGTSRQCDKVGQQACVRVDAHGVIRIACINEVSK